jgi:hypothetical protein
MTIYEQIKEVVEGKVGQVFTSNDIKQELKNRFGRNPDSVIPSDFCYNRVNDGIRFEVNTRLFEYVDGKYKYLGENCKYTGMIYHKKKESMAETVVGYWVNGKRTYPLRTVDQSQ